MSTYGASHPGDHDPEFISRLEALEDLPVTLYCARCGESPTSGTHAFGDWPGHPKMHAYVDPRAAVKPVVTHGEGRGLPNLSTREPVKKPKRLWFGRTLRGWFLYIFGGGRS